MAHEVHLELLLGRKVHDADGAFVGRIEEVRAEQQHGETVITEYLVGRLALMERLSAWNIGLALVHLLGARKSLDQHVIPWDQLDLSDPERPCLRCTIAELKRSSLS